MLFSSFVRNQNVQKLWRPFSTDAPICAMAATIGIRLVGIRGTGCYPTFGLSGQATTDLRVEGYQPKEGERLASNQNVQVHLVFNGRHLLLICRRFSDQEAELKHQVLLEF